MVQRKDKIILKIFDKRVSEEKRPHNCSLCQTYKREMKKGNKDALEFYKEHINEIVKKYNGATLVLDQTIGADLMALEESNQVKVLPRSR